MADPLDIPSVKSVEETDSLQQDKDLPGYRYARALAETARSAAGDRVKSFKSNWDYFQGRNHWPAAATTAAAALDAWAFKGVVNWTTQRSRPKRP